MSGLEIIAPFLAAAGTGVGAVGTIASGVAADRAARQDALNLQAAGREEFAAAQRQAEAKRREGRLINSRAQAIAAASGAGAGLDAPSVVRIMKKTAQDAEYGAQVELFGGRTRQLGAKQAALARRSEGRSSLLGSFVSGFGQFAKAGSQLPS